ncbi:MAG: CusA/CzcA family heavy metal efflux RND transporter [Crocinitomicaceae bacterium]|jgi:cobalt-zinc-cadmium resistance protein CzcA
MLNKIIEFSVKQKLIVGLFILFLIAFGAYEVTKLPIDAVPDITNNQVQIITSAPALGATDIERLVTFPVEQSNSNIHGLKEIRSFSRFGLSVVTLIFDDATDVYWARQQVQERLQNVKDQIPKGVGIPSMGPITTGLGEIYQYMVRPKKGYEGKYDETELRTIQDWIVRRELLRVEGIADVSSFGGKLKQFEIAIDINKLNAFGISVDDVFNAVEQNNQNTGGAYIEKNNSVLYIRTEGLLSSIEDLNQIAIKTTNDGVPLLVRDVAEVKIGHAIRYGGMTYNGKGEVAGAVVMMVKGGNSSQVIKDVKAKIEEIQKTLPEGVVIEPFLDRTKMVNNAISTVETNLLEGALIVVFILVLFLGNFRAGLLVASVIPLAMLFAIIMMNVFGVSGNLMSLGALDFGLIIDGAVIIVEATMHQLTHSKKFKNVSKFSQGDMDGIVKQSTTKMMNSAVFGQIIILVVYLPIFTLQGIEGKMFKPMAQTVAFALIGAFILSLTYVPMMSALILSKKASHKPNFSDRLMGRLERIYQQSLERVLNFPKTVISIVLGLFAIAVLVMMTLGGEFIPALEEGDFAVETRVLTGTSLQGSLEACLKAEKILLERFPEVIKVVGKTGSGEIPTDPMPMEATDLMIILKDKKEWTSAKTFDELAEKMGKELEDVPGVTFGFQYPVQMRFNELMTGARQDVVCKIYGENLDTLAHYANKLAAIVSGISGAADLFVEPVVGMPQIVIKYNRSAISQYGLTIEQVNRTINTVFSGQSTGMMYEGEKRFDVVVRVSEEKRKDVSDVQNMLVSTPSGLQIPLSTLAKVDLIDGPNQIQRENTKRRIVVGFNARGRDVQSLVEELSGKVEKQIKLPVGYTVEYGGSFKNLEEAKQRLSIAVPLALLLIFLLLYFAFNSLKQGLLIFSAIPLSAIGGIFALAILDLPFSISAGVGFIALFGVAVLNGIVLIAEFNRLNKEGITNLKQVVLMGTKIRMRPVLMTAFVASLGFLPMAMSHGAGAEVQSPLASVVIGGLLLATFLTLFVLPILYAMFTKTENSKGSNTLNATLIIISLCLFGNQANAQQTISLKASIDSALLNNDALRSEQLRVLSQKQQVKSVSPFSTTDVQAEFGRLNSRYYDNRLNVNQNIDFPLVYKRKREIAQVDLGKSNLQLELKQKELKKQVSISYFTYLILLEKNQLLKQADSIYAAYLSKAEMRIRLGEGILLEKTTIENQRIQIAGQLKQLDDAIENEERQFQYLLNTKKEFIPEKVATKSIVNLSGQKNTFESHPTMKLLDAEIQMAISQYKFEKAKLLPQIQFGVVSGTMYGYGADNVFYTHTSRFTSGQIGITVPLLSKQGRSIKSAQLHTQMTEFAVKSEKRKWQIEMDNRIRQFQTQTEIISNLEEKALPNAKIIFETANKQFSNGEINYLEWAMLINQSIAIQSDYQDALMRYNELGIEMIYLGN